MALIDLPNRAVRFRVVYAGPAAGGKTTNLRQVHALVPAAARGQLASIAASDGHTLVRDDLPLDLGLIGGWHVSAGLSTIPGQPDLADARAAVLAGADAVVFVADSDPARQEANAGSMAELRALLAAAARDGLPLVIQVNKRDLPEALPEATVADPLLPAAEVLPAVALAGNGVIDALRAACKLAVRNL